MRFGFWKTVVPSAVVLVVLLAALNWNALARWFEGPGERPITLYCAAGIKDAVKPVADAYEREYGVRVEVDYAGSGDLLGKIQVAEEGDLYLAADTVYMEDARELGLIEEVLPIATQTVVIVVAKGNPKNITSLAEVMRDDGTLSLANHEAAAVSRFALRTLRQAEGTSVTWEQLWEKKITARPTVNAVANDVKLNSADAGIVWDATAEQYEELEAIAVPEFSGVESQIAVAVLKTSTQPTRALHFARYLTARDRGLTKFAKYRVVEGDVWADRPEIKVYVGGVNRPAVEEIISNFRDREGVEVLTSYNGCGVLVSQMETGGPADVYFACDTTFMDMVANDFAAPRNVSATDMVIIAKQGNPKKITGVNDLRREGLVSGLCNPEFSALGELSKRLLEKPEYGIWREVYDSAGDHPATADVLVVHVAEGRMDAAIVYRANTTYQREKLEIIEIHDPAARAVQPIATAKNSKHRYLSQRLMDRICAADARERFEKQGFDWLAPESNP